MKKIQSFHIIKFDSARLLETNFNVNITLQQAILNSESVRLSDSSLLRYIRKIKNSEFSSEKLNNLQIEIKNIKKSQTDNKKEKIQQIKKQIEDLLFVPELVNVYFSNVSHYKKLVEKGFYVNGNKFTRLLSSAGMSRRSTVTFIDERYFDDVVKFVDCGRDETVEFNENKFSAYFGLCSSSTLSVSFPRFIVVPDKEILVSELCDFVNEPMEIDLDSVVEEKMIETTKSVWDGQGLISPLFASKWADDIEIDYIPSSFIVRSAWSKGLLVVFDFHSFAEEKGIQKVKDIYGDEHEIKNIDVLLSLSQFKAASAYKSMNDIISKMKYFGWDFGVTRVSPKYESNVSKLSYQYIQGIPLTDNQIDSLTKETRNHFENVITNKDNSSDIFNLGEIDITKKNWFYALEPIVQASLLNKDVCKDSFFKKKMSNQINKKMKETFLGKIFVNGNYQFLICDPVGQIEHILGLDVKGILKSKEFYSHYWNEKNISQICAMRSPLTYKIEKCVLDLVDSKEMNRWFFYLKSGIILNMFDDIPARMSGCDHDGDAALTTCQEELLDKSDMGKLVKYEIKKAPKTLIVHSELWKSDARSFKNKIGAITNQSTSFYCLLENFEKNSYTYNKILDRIKILNAQQSQAIDAQKGIKTHPYPDHFSKITKPNDKHTPEQIKEIEFNNTIVVNKRPYFFKYLYADYAKKYKTELQRFDTIALRDYGCTMESILSANVENLSLSEKRLLEVFKEKSSFMFYPSVMNRIAWFMEKEIDRIKKLSTNKHNEKFDYACLLSKNFIIPSEEEIEKIKSIFYLYKDLKKQLRYQEENENNFETTAQISNYINEQAYEQTGWASEKLADLAVYLCYEVFKSGFKGFAWYVFGEEIVENMLDKSNKIVEVSVKDENGEIEYLFDKFSMQKIEIL